MSPTSRRLPRPLADRASGRGAGVAELPVAASSTCGPRKRTSGWCRGAPGGCLVHLRTAQADQGAVAELCDRPRAAGLAARSGEEQSAGGGSWPTSGPSTGLRGQIRRGTVSWWPKLADFWSVDRGPRPDRGRNSQLVAEVGRLPAGPAKESRGDGRSSFGGVSSACSPGMCAIRGPRASFFGVSSACSPGMCAIRGPRVSSAGVSSSCSPGMCAIRGPRASFGGVSSSCSPGMCAIRGPRALWGARPVAPALARATLRP